MSVPKEPDLCAPSSGTTGIVSRGKDCGKLTTGFRKSNNRIIELKYHVFYFI